MTAEERKERPVFSGVLKYFPDALLEVAKTSWAGNQQHHPDKPLHWDRSKSTDELDALTRHLIQAGTLDTDGIRHSAKVAWRALANLQKEIENEREHSIKHAATNSRFTRSHTGTNVRDIEVKYDDVRAFEPD